jgi:hypothetical protein
MIRQVAKVALGVVIAGISTAGLAADTADKRIAFSNKFRRKHLPASDAGKLEAR